MVRTEKKARKQAKKAVAAKPVPLVSPSVAPTRLQRWRWPILIALYWTLSVLVLFASLIPLFNIVRVDDGIRNLLVYYVGSRAENKFDPRLEVVLVSQNQQPEGPWGQIDPSHRVFYSEMLRSLSAAGARMVIFDMEFAREGKDRQVDLEFAQTIAELKNTEVMVAADLNEGDTFPIFAPALEPVLKDRWAIWDGAKAKGSSSVRLVRLGIVKPGQENVVGEQSITPSLTLHVLSRARYAGQNIQPFFDPFMHEVRLREGGAGGREVDHFPVNKELYFMVDLIAQDEMGRHPPFHEVYSQRQNPNYMRNFNNKFVIIGYEKGDEKQTDEGKRFGTDIQVSAMSNLLQNSFIHPLSLSYHYLVILVMIALGAVLSIRFRNLMTYTLPIRSPVGFIEWKPQVPVVLIVVSFIYICVAVLGYLTTRTLFPISYHIAALFLAYLITIALSARLGFK
jgi:hypothetical protein